MILADRFAASVDTAVAMHDPDAPQVADAIANAALYVFPEDVAALCLAAADQPDEIAAYVPLPALTTWIEFVRGSGAIAVFLAATSNLRAARCLVVEGGKLRPALRVRTAVFDLDAGGMQGKEYERLNRQLLGALALLATPKIIRPARIDQTRLNHARSRLGKPGLLSHDLVNLSLSRPERGPSLGERGPDGRRTKQHFVRAFLRHRYGQMELVRPHWRGYSGEGTTPARFKVRP